MPNLKQYQLWIFFGSSLYAVIALLSFNLQLVHGQSCEVPAVNGFQPYPAALAPVFTSACTNSLVTDKPTPEVPGVPAVAPKPPRLARGYPTSVAKLVDGYIPCVILMSIGQQESQGWKQFNASYGASGNTVISGDCGYGITQITGAPIMTGSDSNVNRNRVAGEATYNIGTGAYALIGKWNDLSYYSGNNDPYIAEDWYYAVWAYNKFSWQNNPNRNCPSNNPVCGTAFNPNRAPYTGNSSQIQAQWPYQELVWGWAANPPTDPQDSSKKFWQPVALTLPPRSDLAAPVNGNPTQTHINTPQPAHGSCTKLFAPMIVVPSGAVQSSSL
jgi:hypothetical protein